MRKFIILLCFAIIACNVTAQPIEEDENKSNISDGGAVDWDDVEDSLDTDGNDDDNAVSKSDSDDDDATEDGEEDGQDNAIEGSDEDECETICTRIYRPICAQIKGTPVTFPTRCELDNKIRCATVALGAEKAAAIYSFVHNGPCDEQ